MKVYGVSVSYFTGKMEAYLRYKGIEYDKDHPFADQKRIREHVGAIQVPLIERDDGRWMSDTTPMIQQLETEYPDRPVMPADPVVRFIALLMEDYADEWLWRSAMHYRWSYDHGRELISRVLADEILSHLWYPRIVRRHLMKYRQRVGYVVNDGVNAETWDHVEAGYFNALRNMTTMLEDRPFLLGNSPSIADFGFMGPMFRHFSQDPDPTAIMRDKAPDVFEWVGRVWNASKRYGETALLEQVPDDAAPMLKEIAETHLVQLRENSAAYGREEMHFQMTAQGCHYAKLPTSQYRVWCLERLREHFDELTPEAQGAVKQLLPYPDASVLWDRTVAAISGYDTERLAPFNKAIKVFAPNRAEGRFGK